ncbi:hypothetical protein FACS1894172_07720 [Spirochaetia bacterium]|nr:hypothetical protein FACS1894164_06200 [Spirochaetia bacterium]GHU31950.1 hypothetical protein FACS1894172_07720 [Spirochaetia bacterium]
MFSACKVSVRGSDHTRDGADVPCQDYADFADFKNGTVGIALVADGHGSPAYFRSHHGSKLAVECAKGVIHTYLNTSMKGKSDFYAAQLDDAKIEASLKDQERCILEKWRSRVCEHYKEHPLDENELQHCNKYKLPTTGLTEDAIVRMYGSTLLVTVLAPEFWFHIQIGDGWTVLIKKPGQSEGIFPYEHDQDGRADSLCQVNAIERFKHRFGREKVLGAISMTDGISESFPQPPQDLLYWLNNSVLDTYIYEFDTFEAQLETVLHIRAKSYGDDCSLVIMFDNAERDKLRKTAENTEQEKANDQSSVVQDTEKLELYGEFTNGRSF